MVKPFDDTLASKLACQGRLREAASLLEIELAKNPECDQAALALARIYMRAGHILRAQGVLAGRPSPAAPPLMTLIFRLEEQWTRLLTDFDLAAVRERNQGLCREMESMNGPGLDRLTARAIAARIDCAAATYSELTSAQKEELKERLLSLGEKLIAAGELDQGYNALVNAITLLVAEVEQPPVLQHLSERMRTLARDDLAADALVRLARMRLKAGADEDSIRPPLIEAERLAAVLGHDLLPIEVAQITTKLRIDRQGAPLSELEDVARAYQERDLPSRALDVLIDLSSFAHQMGDVSDADRYRAAQVAVAECAGLNQTLTHASLAEAELLTRTRATSEAIAICKEYLGKPLPRSIRGAFTQIMASAYGFSGDAAESRKAIDEALRLFGEVGALELQSTTVTSFINDQYPDAREAVLNDLTDMGTYWVEHDIRYGLIENAAAKCEILAAIQMRLFRLSRDPTPNSQWRLEAAERYAARAAELADMLTGKAKARQAGNVCQTRSEIVRLQGQWRRAVAHLYEADSVYRKAGLDMEAANSLFLAGKILDDVARRGAASEGSEPSSDAELLIEADKALSRAQGYYELSGMRSELARSLLARAEIHAIARLLATSDTADALRQEALAFLVAAESLLDEVRGRFQGETTIRSLMGRRKAVEECVPIYRLALQLLAERTSDLADLWKWHQRSRGRALGDVLARQPLRAAEIETRLAKRPDLRVLVQREKSLAGAIQTARPDTLEDLRRDLHKVRADMAQSPELQEIVHLRSGLPPNIETMQGLLGATPDRPAIYVDWVVAGTRVGLMATSSSGIHPVRWLEGPVSTVAGLAHVIATLGRDFFREEDAERKLAALSSVLEPLNNLTRPGDHLILSPSGPLASLPLHAVPLDGSPLIVRNPVSYCASAQLLHSVLARPLASGRRAVRIFADPASDRPASLRLGRELAEAWGTTLTSGSEVTATRFLSGLNEAGLVHYQGHASLNEVDPLRSHLALSDRQLSVADILSGQSMSSGLVVLVACGAGASRQSAGDEPMGLPMGILLAGASSVIAPIWPVHEDEAAEFSRMLHSALRSAKGQTLADVLRSVQLDLLVRTPTTRLQAWAPYVLHGNWRQWAA